MLTIKLFVNYFNTFSDIILHSQKYEWKLPISDVNLRQNTRMVKPGFEKKNQKKTGNTVWQSNG